MLTQLGLLSIQNDSTHSRYPRVCECYIEGRVHVCVSEHSLLGQRYARVLCPLCKLQIYTTLYINLIYIHNVQLRCARVKDTMGEDAIRFQSILSHLELTNQMHAWQNEGAADFKVSHCVYVHVRLSAVQQRSDICMHCTM
jgi:hypothetical protein